MGLLGDIGGFLERTIVYPIGRHIVRPIDRALTQPLCQVTDKDVALKPERARIETLRLCYGIEIRRFFENRQSLDVARAEYAHVVGDFRTQFGEEATHRQIRRIAMDPGGDDPGDLAGKIGKELEDGARLVLGALTLDLTAILWNVNEIPAERKRLDKRADQYSAALSELRQANAKMTGATRQLEEETARMGDLYAALLPDTPPTAPDFQAREAAQRGIVIRLFSDGHGAEAIAATTGFAPDFVAAVARDRAVAISGLAPDRAG
ncbi:MAG: hypothetical protein KDE03_08945 [Rhodobacteraceae bacterium]|nr:hypothetical protein [Paracoccaceae bacterium]